MTNAERQRRYRERRKGGQETVKVRTDLQKWNETHWDAMNALRAWRSKYYKSMDAKQEAEFDRVVVALAGTEAAFRTIAWSGVPWERRPEWMRALVSWTKK